MQLTHDRAEGYFFIRACKPDAIVVIDRELRQSFAMAPDRVIEDWPVRSISELDEAAVRILLELEPELVLIGSGQRQALPARERLLSLLAKGIGVEVMDNAAASRTYNLLAGEGRRVIVAFILAGESSPRS